MRRRRLILLLFVLLTPMLLLGIFLVFERVRGQIALAAYKRQLVANGEKLTFDRLVSPTAQGKVNSEKVFDSIRRLQDGTVLTHDIPPCMRMTPSVRAVVGFREDEWIGYKFEVGKTTNTWEQVAADLRANYAILDQLRADLPASEFSSLLDYSMGHQMMITNLSPPKSVGFWLAADTQLALREGRKQDAVDSLVAYANVPRLLADNGILISERVRIAIMAMARSVTWESLQAEGWTDQQLAQIQRAWEINDFVEPMTRSFKGERAFGITAFQDARHSNQEAAAAFFYTPTFLFDEKEHPWWRKFMSEEVHCRIWRFAWLDQHEHRYLIGIARLIEMSRLAATEKSQQQLATPTELFNNDFTNRNSYDNLRFPEPWGTMHTFSRSIERALKAETDKSTVLCAIAIRRYGLRHGKPPPTLDALTPEFLSSVPIDYMDGKPMKYHLTPDGSYTLYSVGLDGLDDGGDTSFPKEGFYSSNIWTRRDVVWPRPALPEEVEAWRVEEAKN